MNRFNVKRCAIDLGTALLAATTLMSVGCSEHGNAATAQPTAAPVASRQLLTGWRHPQHQHSVKLPASFELTGCDADRLCQVVQNGDDYKAVCDAGATELALTVEPNRGSTSVSWTGADGEACTTELLDGQLSGNCVSDAGSCEISTLAPLPSPRCLELPTHLTFAGCDLPTTECEITQTACMWQGRCDDGATFIGGRVNASGPRWTRADGLRCTSTIDNGVVTGTCEPPAPEPEEGQTAPVDAGTAESCDFTATQPADAPTPPTCAQLPSTFAVDVCGEETVCNVLQRGCIWEAHCEDDVFAGRAVDNVFGFEDGACNLTVENGSFTGTCQDEQGTCALTQKDLVPSSTCKTLPATLELSGCGLEGECKTIQNGCVWQASCNDDAIFYNGYATEQGITLIGSIDESVAACQATFDAAGNLTGGCSPLSDAAPDGGTPPQACELTGAPPTAATPATTPSM